jgi:hypothetical protein
MQVATLGLSPQELKSVMEELAEDNDRAAALIAAGLRLRRVADLFRHYKPPQIFDRIETAIAAPKRKGFGAADSELSTLTEGPPAASPRPAEPFVGVLRRGKPFATGF